VGYVIEKVDLVLVGAEGVAETGGIINHIGTYQIAMISKEKKKPFYAVTESYKFVRMFPLDQYDMGLEQSVLLFSDQIAEEDPLLEASVDFITPDERLLSPRTSTDDLLPETEDQVSERSNVVSEMIRTNPSMDYTPPQYITLLFTDKGVLTPSAVSDELIKVFL
jgi:translation initiation factor eIF-2B subunit alpha